MKGITTQTFFIKRYRAEGINNIIQGSNTAE